jgi:hypothetical protein
METRGCLDMPRGKKQSNRPSAGGIKRNDYHRRNRKRPASMFCTSHGYQVGSRGVLNADGLRVTVIARHVLEHRAVRDWKKFNKGHQYEPAQLETICLGYIRHRLTNYDRLSTALYGDAVVQLKRHLFAEIALAYPWLADKCQSTLEHQLRRDSIRVIKRPKTLTQLLVQEHNEKEEAQYRNDSDAWHDEVSLSGSLSSLASSRLLFLPPFLSRNEIRERRFGGQVWMNDNWWEWEQEKQIKVPERERRFRWSN